MEPLANGDGSDQLTRKHEELAMQNYALRPRFKRLKSNRFGTWLQLRSPVARPVWRHTITLHTSWCQEVFRKIVAHTMRTEPIRISAPKWRTLAGELIASKWFIRLRRSAAYGLT